MKIISGLVISKDHFTIIENKLKTVCKGQFFLFWVYHGNVLNQFFWKMNVTKLKIRIIGLLDQPTN